MDYKLLEQQNSILDHLKELEYQRDPTFEHSKDFLDSFMKESQDTSFNFNFNNNKPSFKLSSSTKKTTKPRPVFHGILLFNISYTLCCL